MILKKGNCRTILLAGFFLFASCKTSFVTTKATYNDYQINNHLPKDSSLIIMLQPYHDSVAKNMNDIVGVAEKTLNKSQPEGKLGNFMADALLYMARQKFKIPIDAAFVNEGGIRLNQIPAGPITRGKIFELMPFDNLLVVQQLKGTILKQFLDLTAKDGGWPVAGITMQIKNKKAVNIMVNGKPFDVNTTYTIVNSNYIANGGDNAAMLKTIPQQNIGYLMRDALFDYVSLLKTNGQLISANLQNRVTNAQ